jgi:aspartyl-tRNA(Asn)/glutamyl-tRNA(Gln) amidotransferase subunit A
VRIPASLCGIVGIKPTYGRVSRAGVMPLAWSLDTIGPMTRSCEDAALMLGVLAGHDPADPASSRAAVPDYAAGLAQGARGLRVGVIRTTFFDALEPGVRAAVEAAAQALPGLGVAVEEVRLPRMVHAAPATFAIISAEAMAVHEPWLRTRAADYGADVRTRLEAGQFVLATQYLKAQRARQVIAAEVDAVLRTFDALLLPTTPVAAPRVTDQRVTVGDATDDVRAWLTRCTRPFNVTGHPVLSVPCGLTPDGLPVGLSLVGRRFDEATLLRLGHAYEAIGPLRGKTPPLAG